MRALVVSWAAGLLFAVGLAIGGMTRPAKVLAFLDLAGKWDPSLAFVMAGAIAVHALAYRLVRRRRTPFFAASFALPPRSDVDPSLVAGALCFGVGWGLAGYCPGPALTGLASGAVPTCVFVAGMVLGMAAHGWRVRRTAMPAGRATV